MKAIPRIASAMNGAVPGDGVDHYARRLREENDDLWPAGGRGGGKNAPHVQRHHVANLLMSFAATAPIEGPRAVEAIRRLRRTGSQSIIELRKQGEEPTFLTRLAGQIRDERDPDPVIFGDRLEQLIQDAAFPTATSRVLMAGIEVLLSMEPARAEIVWHYANGTNTEIFEPPEQPPPVHGEMPLKRPTRRGFIFNEDVINAAGEVWEDTVRAGRAVPPQHPSTAEGIEDAE